MNRLKNVLLLLGLFLVFPMHDVQAQINTNRVMTIGRNALYFEDYVLSIQYFNLVIRVKPHLPEPYFYRAVAKISLEDYKGAEEDCSLALERNPFLVEAYRCRGIARVYLGKKEEAKSDFDKGLEFSPDDKQLLLCKGYVSMEMKDFHQAIIDFSLVIDKYPRFKEAYLNRGYAYLSGEDTLNALTDFEKMLDLDRFSADGHAARGYVLYTQKQFSQALSDLDEAIRLEPYKTNYYINRGLVRYELNNLRGAMDDYDHVIQLDPYNTMAYYNRGVLRTNVGDKNRAVEDFDRVIEIEPTNYFAIYNRALLQCELGELDKSIKDFTTIINEYPDFFPAYYGRGEAKSKRFDKLGAEKDFNTGMLLSQRKLTKKDIVKNSTYNTRKKSDKNLNNHKKLVVADKEEENKRLTYKSESRGKVQNVNFQIEPEPNIQLTCYPTKKSDVHQHTYYNRDVEKMNTSGLFNRPFTLTNNEEPSKNQVEKVFKEIETLTEVLEKSPVAENYFHRAVLLEYISDFDGAIEDYGRAIEKAISPDKWIYYFCRANCRVKKIEYETIAKENELLLEDKKTRDFYYAKLNYDEILRDYETVNELNNSFAFSWFNRANMLSSKKDYRNAIANYTLAIEREKDFAEAYFNRGLCYLMIGENAKGVSDLSKAGELGLYVAYNVIKRFRE